MNRDKPNRQKSPLLLYRTPASHLTQTPSPLLPTTPTFSPLLTLTPRGSCIKARVGDLYVIEEGGSGWVESVRERAGERCEPCSTMSEPSGASRRRQQRRGGKEREESARTDHSLVLLSSRPSRTSEMPVPAPLARDLDIPYDGEVGVDRLRRAWGVVHRIQCRGSATPLVSGSLKGREGSERTG